ncbi:ABC transporter permease subunit [Xylophilus sp. Kf1]|nr:ABC transporter permease subunit [Xylophilus sp. Kf1]
MTFIRRHTSLLLQAAILAVIALAVWLLLQQAFSTLRSRGVHAGFDFLRDAAGFEISEGWLAFDSTQPFWKAFLAGLVNTVRAAVPAIVIAVVLGTLLGIGRLTRHSLVRGLASMYVQTVRNVPLLVQLLLLYFALTHLLPDPENALQILPGVSLGKSGLAMPWPVHGDGGWALEYPERTLFGVIGGAALSPEYLAITLALGLYTASFVAEIVRAGIESVGSGQVMAARALGLSPTEVMRLVVLPQAMRLIVPALTSQVLSLVKNSSLAVAIGYPELVSIANTSLNATGRPFECIAVVMAVYLLLSLSISLGMNLYNRRVVLRGWA